MSHPSRRSSTLAALLVALAIVLGCASTVEERVLPPDEQYALAVEAYESGDYRNAIQALQTFTFNYPQDPRIVDARWLTAEAYYASEDWVTAAGQYLDFQRDYGREARAPEALYLAGRSYQHLSLRPELDQRDTERAINLYDQLLQEYPASEFAGEARERRLRLRDKLAEKVYLVAEFYFDNEEYQAAEIYLTDLIERFPESDWLPAGLALLARTFCAEGREERASDAHRALRTQYPESSAVAEVTSELAGTCRAPAEESVR